MSLFFKISNKRETQGKVVGQVEVICVGEWALPSKGRKYTGQESSLFAVFSGF